MPIKVRPTKLDRWIADAVAVRTDPKVERAAEKMTWAADEHVLIAVAGMFWLMSRGSSKNTQRTSSHLLAVAIATAALPHLIKSGAAGSLHNHRSLAWYPAFRASVGRLPVWTCSAYGRDRFCCHAVSAQDTSCHMGRRRCCHSHTGRVVGTLVHGRRCGIGSRLCRRARSALFYKAGTALRPQAKRTTKWVNYIERSTGSLCTCALTCSACSRPAVLGSRPGLNASCRLSQQLRPTRLSTQSSHGIEVDDALAIAEQVDV
jgi:hypothetical protein